MLTTTVMPKRSLEITVKENNYTLNYPSTGQLIDIEVMKASLSGNSYGAISEGNTDASIYARFLIDMIAIFNVLCLNLKKDLKVRSISELDVMDSKILLQIYMKEVLPWMKEWERVLNADDTEEDKKEA